MNKSKYSEEQIATALRHVEAGGPVTEVKRKLGISEATYYIWRRKYIQMGIGEIGPLRQLEDENRKLKQLVTPTVSRLMFGVGGTAFESFLRRWVYTNPNRMLRKISS